MPTLLHISASPRGAASESLALARTFLEAFHETHPDVPVTTFDLWAEATFRRVDAADRYLFSVPMWNAGVPYVLKQLIDVISQPGMLFSFDPEKGYSGLLTGKKAAVVYTSAVYGPDRGPAFGQDFQATFFTDWLRWAGISDVTEIHLRPDLAAPDVEARRQLAHAQARDAGKLF